MPKPYFDDMIAHADEYNGKENLPRLREDLALATMYRYPSISSDQADLIVSWGISTTPSMMVPDIITRTMFIAFKVNQILRAGL